MLNSPSNIDLAAERGVLGGLLVSGVIPAEVGEQTGRLVADDFYDSRHGLVFKALLELHANHEPVEAASLHSVLVRKGWLDMAGGIGYVLSLDETVLTGAYIEHYAGRVRECATLRMLENSCREAAHQATLPSATPTEMAAKLQDLTQAALDRTAAGDIVTMAAAVRQMMTDFDLRKKHGRDARAVSTGFPSVNRMLGGGMRPGQYIVVAGRPGMGKTAFAMAIGTHCALSRGLPSLIFGLEQDEQELSSRLMCSLAKIDTEAWFAGTSDRDAIARAVSWEDRLSEAPIYWACDGMTSVGEVLAKARQVKQRHGLGVVVLDYIGLLVTSIKHRNDELTSISAQIKQAAKSLGCPWVVVAQLNRDVEKRSDRKPQMSDLRDSGSIEQDADVVALLYRKDYYDPACGDTTGIIDIAKQKNGRTGAIKMNFWGRFTKWEDFDEYR